MASKQSQNPTYSRAFAMAMAAALATRPMTALADSLEVHLWQGEDFQPTLDTDAADFADAECDFTDYAAVTGATLTTPANLSEDANGAIVNEVFAISHAVVTANDVRGYWLESAGMVVLFEAFDPANPVSMSADGDFLDLLVALPVTYTQAAA